MVRGCAGCDGGLGLLNPPGAAAVNPAGPVGGSFCATTPLCIWRSRRFCAASWRAFFAFSAAETRWAVGGARAGSSSPKRSSWNVAGLSWRLVETPVPGREREAVEAPGGGRGAAADENDPTVRADPGRVPSDDVPAARREGSAGGARGGAAARRPEVGGRAGRSEGLRWGRRGRRGRRQRRGEGRGGARGGERAVPEARVSKRHPGGTRGRAKRRGAARISRATAPNARRPRVRRRRTSARGERRGTRPGERRSSQAPAHGDAGTGGAPPVRPPSRDRAAKRNDETREGRGGGGATARAPPPGRPTTRARAYPSSAPSRSNASSLRNMARERPPGGARARRD